MQKQHYKPFFLMLSTKQSVLPVAYRKEGDRPVLGFLHLTFKDQLPLEKHQKMTEEDDKGYRWETEYEKTW